MGGREGKGEAGPVPVPGRRECGFPCRGPRLHRRLHLLILSGAARVPPARRLRGCGGPGPCRGAERLYSMEVCYQLPVLPLDRPVPQHVLSRRGAISFSSSSALFGCPNPRQLSQVTAAASAPDDPSPPAVPRRPRPPPPSLFGELPFSDRPTPQNQPVGAVLAPSIRRGGPQLPASPNLPISPSYRDTHTHSHARAPPPQPHTHPIFPQTPLHPNRKHTLAFSHTNIHIHTRLPPHIPVSPPNTYLNFFLFPTIFSLLDKAPWC